MTSAEKLEALFELQLRMNRAETAEEVAEICRLEAEILDRPLLPVRTA